MVESAYNRDDVVRLLTENEYTNLTFYKVNGELRDMVATLNQDQLALLAQDPEIGAVALGSPAEDGIEYDLNQVRVFDLEKKGWRSFLLTNLVSIEGVNT